MNNKNHLNWRTVGTLELTEKLIPDPNAEHELLQRLTGVSVAIDGGFLHIDPWPVREERIPNQPRRIHVIPASAVRHLEYRLEEPPAPDLF